MMVHVTKAKKSPDRSLRPPVMQMIMEHVVAEIAGHKSGENWQGQNGPEDDPEHRPGCGDDRNTHQGRHDEPQRVIRMIVVDVMQQELDPPSRGRAEPVMEQESMAGIL